MHNQGSGSGRPYRRSGPSQRSDDRSHDRSQDRSSHHSSSSSHHQRRSHSHHRRKRPGTNPVQEVVMHASRRLSNHSPIGIFFLAFLGGGLVTLGAFFGVTLASSMTSPAVQSLLLSIGVSTGLLMTIGINAVLFTEPNVIMPSNLYNTTVGQGFGRLFQFWILAWIGNLLGAWAFAWVIKFGHSYSPESITFLQTLVTERLTQTAASEKMSYFQLFSSGVLGNWVLGFAFIYSVYNRAAVGKIFILLITVGLVVATNLQFYPLNLSYFSILKATGATQLNWFQIITGNLLSVSMGNLFGGAFLVALPLLFQTRRVRAS